MKNPINSFATFAAANGSYVISFEGIEGAGKSTQIRKVQEYLETHNKQVHIFREPGATELGEKLRSVILNQKDILNPLTEALIFAAARVELIEQKLSKILSQKNQIILLDRFIDSSFAYQGVARGLGIETIEHIHALSPLNHFPHLTLYLSISLETSLERQNTRGNQKDYFEKEADHFHQKLKLGFDQVALRWPERVKTIDAEQSPEKVFTQINKYIDEVVK